MNRASIIAWWQGLAQRDQRVLLIAAPVILVLLAYLLLVAPIQRYHASAERELVAMKSSYFWLRQQEGLASSSCAGAPAQGAPTDWLRTQAQSLGLAGLSIQPTGDAELELSLPAGSGQAFLRLLDRAHCQGFTPLALNLEKLPGDNDDWAADVSLVVLSGS